MEIEHVTKRMEESAAVIRAAVAGITEEQARWKPDADTWSVREVMGHLWDEEKLDFRVRIDYTLRRPGETWPPIDPAGWVKERRYNEQALADSLAGFLEERQASLAWLRGLQAPDWAATYQAPWGAITAGDLLASWLAHDLLHLRQLVELRWALITSELEPSSVRYAGEW